MGTLRISLFGGVRVLCEDFDPPREVKITHNVKLLLAYLLLQPRRSYQREVLADLSWGERSEEQARSCLNTTLWRLRRALEPQGTARGAYLVTTSAGEVGFNWQGDFWLDLAEFEAVVTQALAQSPNSAAAIHATALEDVLPLYQGELLEGLYDDWALRARERARSMYLDCLGWLMRYYRRQGDCEASLSYGRQILALEPLREEIHREMMRLYVDAGQRSLALKQYLICRKVLGTEMGIEPMAETQALYRELSEPSTTSLAGVRAGRAARASVLPDGAHGSFARRSKGSADDEPATLQEALTQLVGAISRFDSARSDLQQAMHLVERFGGAQGRPPL